MAFRLGWTIERSRAARLRFDLMAGFSGRPRVELADPLSRLACVTEARSACRRRNDQKSAEGVRRAHERFFGPSARGAVRIAHLQAVRSARRTWRARPVEGPEGARTNGARFRTPVIDDGDVKRTTAGAGGREKDGRAQKKKKGPRPPQKREPPTHVTRCELSGSWGAHGHGPERPSLPSTGLL